MEMDELPVSPFSPILAGVPPFVVLSAHLAAGLALGVVYVLAIWKSARLLGEGGSRISVLFLTAARIALLAGSLTLASLEGATPLLAMALGTLIARAIVLRKMSEPAS
jgi:hypothetical protein